MPDDSPKKGLVRTPSADVVRYSNALVRRAIKQITTLTQTSINPSLKRKRVLLISHDEAFNSFFADLRDSFEFRSAGIECTILDAFGNEEMFFELSRREYDLIIPTNMVRSPDTILEAVPQVKRRHPSVKIVVCSGYDSDEFIHKLYAAGIDAFFHLPFEVDELLATIIELIDNPPSQDSRITLLCPFHWFDNNFAVLFEIEGYRSLWSHDENELEEMVRTNDVDIAIEWQWAEQDFPIRDMLRRLSKNAPVFLALNWNGKTAKNFSDLGYAGTLQVPFDEDELRQKFFQVLSPIKMAIFRKTIQI
jgi:CheY-like chemotaxis protein